MLVLTRTVEEAIIIGDGIRVTVLDVRRGKVRLGIEAPGGVSVVRQELLQRDAAGGPGSRPRAAGPPGLTDARG
jgi:carbon storage regulator